MTQPNSPTLLERHRRIFLFIYCTSVNVRRWDTQFNIHPREGALRDGCNTMYMKHQRSKCIVGSGIEPTLDSSRATCALTCMCVCMCVCLSSSPCQAVESTAGGVDSACHPAEVGKMSTSALVTGALHQQHRITPQKMMQPHATYE